MALHTFSQYFDPLYFFIALSIGLFYTYLTTPMPDIIIKYPTPENAGKIIYKDRADVCYKYVSKEVSCPEDKSKIKQLDLQHLENKENPVIKYLSSKIDTIFNRQ
jgi:hypothetical protein